ncbi:hypothetical protein [uncultured Chitinophaga sp.]|uniref:hypothetical protein n=1 Tax=uncultured Chitinophaga sp. TaxID=339340 RepID=UPI0025F267D7|nr:hypothetical protein [uncultured Chitinophaga sp.]
MRVLFTLITALLVFCSCNKEDDNQPESLTGEWYFGYAIEIGFASGSIAKTDVLKFSDNRRYEVVRENRLLQSGTYTVKPGINGYSKVTFSSNDQYIYYIKKTDTGIYVHFDLPKDIADNPGWWLGKR